MTGDRRLPAALTRFLLPLLVLALMSGCSLLRIGYVQLDTYAAWVANDYFDLDAQQKDEFRTRFVRLHEWHRREQLPDYAAFLADTRARVVKGLGPGDLLWVIDGAQARYRALVGHATSDAAALLATLTPAQIEHLKREWDGNNRDFVREHRLDGSAEAQREAATRRALSRIRDWAGTLTVEQEERIALLARDVPPNAPLRHADRLRRQREFLTLMTQRGDRATFAARLRPWLMHWESGRTPEQARLWDESMRKQAAFYAEAFRLLTPEQREHVARRLEGFERDFRRLAQQRPTAAAAAVTR